MATSQPGAQPTNVFQGSANALNAGTNTAMGVATYQPSMTNPQTAQTQTVAGTNLNPYMNPYQQSVIDTTMNGLADQQAMTMNNLDAQASAAGAFGGSRHGVAMGTTNQGYADTQASTLANLNSANYNNAQQMAMYDTGQLNQGAQFNAGLNFQGQVANQQAGLAGAGLNLNAANSLGNMSNLGFGQGMAINNQQMQQGAQQQASMQALIDAQKQQYQGFTNSPQNSLAMQLAALGGVPYNQSQTQTQTPGLFDFLSLGVGM